MDYINILAYSNGDPEGWVGWLVFSIIAGVITILFEVASHQMKTQRGYLALTSIANIFWALMFFFSGLHIRNIGTVLIMILAAVFGVVRGLTFWWVFAKKTRRRKIIGRITLYISMAIVAGAAIFAVTGLQTTTQIIIQSIGILTGLLFIVGQYLPSKHWLRLFVVLYASVIALGTTPLSALGPPIPVYELCYYTGQYVHKYIEGSGYQYLPGEGYWVPMAMAIEMSKIFSITVFYIIFLAKRGAAKRRERLGMDAPPPRQLPPWLKRVLDIIQGSAVEKAYATSINQREPADEGGNELLATRPKQEFPPFFKEPMAEMYRELRLTRKDREKPTNSTESVETESTDESSRETTGSTEDKIEKVDTESTEGQVENETAKATEQVETQDPVELENDDTATK
ncbi:MAG: DMT family transporter [Firmicutes bacterium]|nr:DMT family transporter [Bacillota bacterium]